MQIGNSIFIEKSINNTTIEVCTQGMSFVFLALSHVIFHLFYERDSLALAQHFGKPCLFLTFSANPRWIEILCELFPDQTPSDRPELVAWVFRQKSKVFVETMTKLRLFSRVVAHVHTIKFQKHGLPHMHILIFLALEDKILTTEDIDHVVSAVIPPREEDELLHETVVNCMLHGPCGLNHLDAPWMQNGACTKEFPKNFSPETVITPGAYPEYKRPQDGQTHVKDFFTFDNSWVVPCNPVLSRLFNCHINVEVCTSIKAIKYILTRAMTGSLWI